jgi:hypothetical protein
MEDEIFARVCAYWRVFYMGKAPNANKIIISLVWNLTVNKFLIDK